MKKIFYFEVTGKIQAENESEAKTVLENILNKKSVEYFKIQSLMTEA